MLRSPHADHFGAEAGKGRKDRSVPLWCPTANLIRTWKRQLDCAGVQDFLLPNRGNKTIDVPEWRYWGNGASPDWPMSAVLPPSCK